ncbi:MAG: divalent-cation tolerance protein CutA [candidate division WOR-3 bacterium]
MRVRFRCYQVATTLPTRAAAQSLARYLVEHRFAGCCQVLGPVASIYWWEGKVETGREWLCMAKTKPGRLRTLIRTIEQLHPYDTPEIIALPVVAGSRRYFDWLTAAVRQLEAKERACP